MKSMHPITFGNDAASTIKDTPEPIAASIARLVEENAALRRLAAALSAQLGVPRDLSVEGQLPS